MARDIQIQMVGPKGAKHVEVNPCDTRMCPQQSPELITTVSRAEGKSEQSFIFKGNRGLTRSIPGCNDGFMKHNALCRE